jgi:hypothetical protein
LLILIATIQANPARLAGVAASVWQVRFAWPGEESGKRRHRLKRDSAYNRRPDPAKILIASLPALHVATNLFDDGEGRFNHIVLPSVCASKVLAVGADSFRRSFQRFG